MKNTLFKLLVALIAALLLTLAAQEPGKYSLDMKSPGNLWQFGYGKPGGDFTAFSKEEMVENLFVLSHPEGEPQMAQNTTDDEITLNGISFAGKTSGIYLLSAS